MEKADVPDWHTTCILKGARLRLGKNPKWRKNLMNTMLLNLYTKSQNLLNSEEGQDLVEYALLISLISLAAIAAAGSLAGAITSVFSKISTSLA